MQILDLNPSNAFAKTLLQNFDSKLIQFALPIAFKDIAVATWFEIFGIVELAPNTSLP